MENKKRSLKSNYIFNFISQILTLIIPLITTPYIARILHENGTGQISYATSIITYFLLFANLGFNIYGQREISKARDDINKQIKTFYEVIIIRLITTLISLIVFAILLSTIGFSDNYNLLVLIGGIQIIAVVFDITFYYQGMEDFKSLALRTILVKIVMLILIFVFVKDESDTWLYMLCLSVTTILSNFIMWPSVIKKIRKTKVGKLEFKKHLKPAILIFLPTLAVTIYSVFDKTMIGLLAANPDYENGCYDNAYKINNVSLVLITVISPILIPRNSYDFNSNNMDSLRGHLYFAANYVWILAIPLIFGFAILSENLSSWFLGDGYEEVPLLLRIMSVRFIASGFGVIFGDQLFIAIGKEKYTTIATFIAAFVNVGLNFILIPSLGAVGAAITTAVSELLVTSILAIFVIRGKYISIKKILLMPIKYIIAALFMVIPVYFINVNMDYSILSFLISTVTGALVYGIILIILRDKFTLNIIKKVYHYLTYKLIKGQDNDN